MSNNERQKRNQIKQIIKDLVNEKALKNQGAKDNYLNRLRNVYIKNGEVIFHHFYSDIFPILTDLKKDNRQIEIISQNLEILYKESCVSDNIIQQPLKKLLDHTNLEIARINYITSIDARMDMTGQELRQKYDDLNETASNIKPKVEKLVEQTEHSYSEFVSILGIFSAVVLVYFGGTSILGNVLSTISKTFLLKSIAISIVVGWIVFNIIFMFLYFLSKLLGRSIATITEDIYCSNVIERLKIKYPIIYYFNICFLILIVVDVISWIVYVFNYKYDFVGIIESLAIGKSFEFYILLIVIILLIFIDSIFIIYYVYGKIFDKVTGKSIQLLFVDKSRIYKDDGVWYFVDSWGELRNCRDFGETIKQYLKIKRGNIHSRIINLKRRIFNRYPFIIWINIILIIVILYFI
ncbi:hypothetical protein [Candidatus Stoquefichus massiliensis]|uniref:hypothetical protein n=1 Tax=Candidatus Stoquefichus massiliensis TaxID=1470350 RepID=UPI000481F6F6|nr:hypothetical protein [Candidatus Stoquefichus massiliensis]